MFKDPFASFNFNKPFGARRSRSLFGAHTTPREWKHGARDIPFGMGAMSLYVDGTNGHDSNDGESWKTAKATIQEAVDTADSWTQIFIRSATYAENVVVPTGKDGISLYGEKKSGVVVIPSTGRGIDIASDRCKVYNLTAIGNGLGTNGPGVYFSNYSALDRVAMNLTVGNQYGTGAIGLYTYGEYGLIDHIQCDQTHKPSIGIEMYSAEQAIIRNCYLDSAHSNIYILNSNDIKIHNNTLINAGDWGCYNGGTRNAVYHNNFINNTTQLDNDNVSTVFENFYDDHTNIDNGHGIATEPYIYNTTTIDLRPVCVRNGWNSISLLRSLLRKKTAAQTSQAATDANGTAWVDLKTIAPTTSDIELYRLKLTTAGTWAGTAKYRIIIGSTKVYPFSDDKDIDTGVLEDLIFPINIQINETCKIQFRSDNAGDGVGETVALDQLDYATVL